jgi:hypothetical protein
LEVADRHRAESRLYSGEEASDGRGDDGENTARPAYWAQFSKTWRFPRPPRVPPAGVPWSLIFPCPRPAGGRQRSRELRLIPWWPLDFILFLIRMMNPNKRSCRSSEAAPSGGYVLYSLLQVKRTASRDEVLSAYGALLKRPLPLLT